MYVLFRTDLTRSKLVPYFVIFVILGLYPNSFVIYWQIISSVYKTYLIFFFRKFWYSSNNEKTTILNGKEIILIF